jgi:hypothetical protein
MKDNKLWKAFSEYIRLRDSDENGFCRCITCGIIRFWKQMDCGHGIGRQHKATKYNEMNNHAQCKKCNGFEGGKREVYKIEMDKRYGYRTWAKMEIASKAILKLSQFEIDEMTKFYKKKANSLKKQKGLI